MKNDECVDIDECEAGTHNCPSNSFCENDIAVFKCTADEGFECVGDNCAGSSCNGNDCEFTDVDECEDRNSCKSYDNQGNYIMCVNTFGSFTCKPKIVDDENCRHDDKGRIDVDVQNGWKYRGTSTKTTGEKLGGTPGECKAACTVGHSGYPPYCYTTAGPWDFCACKEGNCLQ